jgi:hypothetical protein
VHARSLSESRDHGAAITNWRLRFAGSGIAAASAARRFLETKCLSEEIFLEELIEDHNDLFLGAQRQKPSQSM